MKNLVKRFDPAIGYDHAKNIHIRDRRDTRTRHRLTKTWLTHPLPTLSVQYCTTCPSDRAGGERLGESNLCKTMASAVPSITDIYSMDMTVVPKSQWEPITFFIVGVCLVSNQHSQRLYADTLSTLSTSTPSPHVSALSLTIYVTTKLVQTVQIHRFFHLFSFDIFCQKTEYSVYLNYV